MCYDQQRSFPSSYTSTAAALRRNGAALQSLRTRLAEAESRLAQARALEAELTQRLNQMKRFSSVMQIIEAYLRRRLLEKNDELRLLPLPNN